MQVASFEPLGEDTGCIGEDELLRFVGGAIVDPRAAEIRAHVDLCDDCREGLAIAGQEAAAALPSAEDPKDEVKSRRLEIGAEVDGRFRIDRQIGQGGMGVVYAATDLSMRRPVALKVLNEESASDKEAGQRFLRETRIAATLKSENAVRVLDAGRLQSGATFMVMELLEGSDLERVVRGSSPVDITRAVQYIAEACDAIGEAHAAGIIHRDLKLANIFLADGPPPVVKVLDFGLAKAARSVGSNSGLTNAHATMGTPHYMSPEQLVSTRDVDARTDVWALGVALYRLTTKQYPFGGAHFASLCAQIMGAAPIPPTVHRPDLPAAVERVILRCLSRSPAHRYRDANELRDALKIALDPSLACDPETAVIPTNIPTTTVKTPPPFTLPFGLPPVHAPQRASSPPLEPFAPFTPPPFVPVGTDRAPAVKSTAWSHALMISLTTGFLAIVAMVALAPSSGANKTGDVASTSSLPVIAAPAAPSTATALGTALAAPAVAEPPSATPSAQESAKTSSAPARRGVKPVAAPSASTRSTSRAPSPPPPPSASSERLYEKM